MGDYVTFSRSFITSDDFVSLPKEARCLYFEVCMNARPKGISCNARSTAKCGGIPEHYLWVLVDKGFLREIDDGHFQIVHWYENNGIGETAKKRNNYPYRVWREQVLERDGHACVKCGATSNLQAHHIKPFATFEECRLDIDNGITLCRKCHAALHKEQRRKEKEECLRNATTG